MEKDEVALELDRRGLLEKVYHMVEHCEWEWDDAVVEVLIEASRAQKANVE